MKSSRHPHASMSRRDMLRGTAALAGLAVGSPLLAACAEEAAAPAAGSAANAKPVKGLKHVTLTQAVSSLAYAQNYVAAAKGYYAEEGLEVETVVTDGGGPDVQAVLAGSAEFTINDGAQVLTAMKQDRSLVAVAATFGRCLVNATMSTKTAKRLGIDSGSSYDERVAALEGARIGVTAPGALTWQIARYNLIKAGLDPDGDAKIIGLGGGPSVLAALEKDQVDVIYISVPFGEAAVSRGVGVTLIDNSAGQDPTLPSFMMEGLWTSPKVLQDDPDTVRAMVAALTRASDFLVASSPEDIVDVLQSDFSSFPPEVLLQAAGQLKSAVAKSGRWDDAAHRITVDVLAENGLLSGGAATPEQFFDDQFL